MSQGPAPLVFRLDELRDPRIVAFLREHLADMHAASPPGSVHALDLEGLRQPDIRFWSAWTGGGESLAGTGALKRIDDRQGEIKSMRTAAAFRGRGIGSAMLAHLLAQARAQGWQRVSLETGAQPFFTPARALYVRHGFVPCGPFAGYRPDPASCFMTLTL